MQRDAWHERLAVARPDDRSRARRDAPPPLTRDRGRRKRCMMRRMLRTACVASSLFVLIGCGDEAAPPPTTVVDPCGPAYVVAPPSAGVSSAEAIERNLRGLVRRDFDPHACLTRVVARRDSVYLEASHEGETIRARLAASGGVSTESLAGHVAAPRLLRTLLDAHVESVVSNGRGVAIGLGDRSAVCYRAAGADPRCIAAPSVRGFDSITEPSAHRLVVRALGAEDGGLEWEIDLGDAASFVTRSGRLAAARTLGSPPPEPDRFARVHSAATQTGSIAPEPAGTPIATAMPTGAATVRLETRTIGSTRLVVLSRCEGLLAHCVTVIGTGAAGSFSLAPTFATDPASIDDAAAADAFGPGALRVRLIEEGHHEGAASEVFVTTANGVLDANVVAIGSETSRGESEVVTEGCYRTLTIEEPGRVRLSGAHGWSGTHTDARGWNVNASTTCAADAVLCLRSDAGFGPCS
jgi:hypothetical protein